MRALRHSPCYVLLRMTLQVLPEDDAMQIVGVRSSVGQNSSRGISFYREDAFASDFATYPEDLPTAYSPKCS